MFLGSPGYWYGRVFWAHFEVVPVPKHVKTTAIDAAHRAASIGAVFKRLRCSDRAEIWIYSTILSRVSATSRIPYFAGISRFEHFLVLPHHVLCCQSTALVNLRP